MATLSMATETTESKIRCIHDAETSVAPGTDYHFYRKESSGRKLHDVLARTVGFKATNESPEQCPFHNLRPGTMQRKKLLQIF